MMEKPIKSCDSHVIYLQWPHTYQKLYLVRIVADCMILMATVTSSNQLQLPPITEQRNILSSGAHLFTHKIPKHQNTHQ
jgi:hypothetical protein